MDVTFQPIAPSITVKVKTAELKVKDRPELPGTRVR
jgi:hypothetical protein